jgi:hypothetical protein
MTFMCLVVTACQALWILKPPIVYGPYVGSFTALLALAPPDGGLGLAFALLYRASSGSPTVPIWGGAAGFFARYLHSPMISGIMVLLAMVQIANIRFRAGSGTREPGLSRRQSDGGRGRGCDRSP